MADLNQTVVATIYQAGGALTDRVSLGALESDTANCPIYRPPNQGEIAMYGQGGKPLNPQAVGTDAWTLATVLGCLPTPVAMSAVKGVTVVQSNGVPELSASSQLSPTDLTLPGDFATSGEVPLIFTDGGTNIFYYRPWRGGTDDNGFDTVQDSSPQPFVIEVFEGPLLTVTPTASATTVTAGATVTFGAMVTPAGQSGISYTWGFDGGAQDTQSSSLPAPSATFDSAGRYDVTVQVSDDAGGGGGATIPITVNPVTTTSPATTTPGGGGGGPSGSGDSSSGPVAGGGHNPGGSSGKPVKTPGTPGATHNTKPAAPGRTTSERKSSTHTNTTPAASGAAGTAGTTHTTTTTSTTSQTATTGPATPAGTVSTRLKALSPSSRARPAPPARPPATSATSTTAPARLVTGRLISDVRPLAPGASPLVFREPAPIPTAPALRRTVRASVLSVLLAGLAVALLFGLGVGRELRWRPNWRALRVSR